MGNGVAVGVPCDLLYEGIPRTERGAAVRINLAPLKARQWIPLAVCLCGLPEEPIIRTAPPSGIKPLPLDRGYG